MFVPPGQGNAAHTHEIEEVFLVLQGYLDVLAGRGRPSPNDWAECIACPAGVIHGYESNSRQPVYFQ